MPIDYDAPSRSYRLDPRCPALLLPILFQMDAKSKIGLRLVPVSHFLVEIDLSAGQQRAQFSGLAPSSGRLPTHLRRHRLNSVEARRTHLRHSSGRGPSHRHTAGHGGVCHGLWA